MRSTQNLRAATRTESTRLTLLRDRCKAQSFTSAEFLLERRYMRWLAWLVVAACASSPAADDKRAPLTSGASTLGGWAETGYLDGPRTVNLFANPVNVTFGPDGRVYVADFDNNKLRVLDATGTASTLIATSGFSRPFGLVFVGATLYVQTDNGPGAEHDTTTGTIWSVDVAARTASVVAPSLGRPRGLAALRDGRIALADYMHHVVELFDPATGTVTPLAGAWDQSGFVDGSGDAARFAEPYAIVQRGDGLLVVTDHGNHALRLVGLDGATTTLAGGSAGYADGALAQARFDGPQGLAIAGGELYVSETGNFRIRRVHDGIVDTVAGNGIGGYLDSDDPLSAELYGLEGLAAAPDGSTLFVADGTRGEQVPFNRVRVIQRAW